MEGPLVASTLIAGLAPLALAAYRGGSRRRVTGFAACLAAGVAGVALAAARHGRPNPETAATDRPLEDHAGGYVSSDACRACHPREYATWHASYHRRMTVVATLDDTLAPWGGRALDAGGATYRPFTSAGAPWIEIRESRGAPAIERRVALLTGSHHMQLYWLPSGRGRELELLPFIWLKGDARWIPRVAAFLQPPDRPEPWSRETGHWNRNCIHCHATQGRISETGRLQDADSRVAELGIACEACHGPAEAHVAAHRQPQKRYREHLRRGDDPTIVDVADLAGRRSAEVCGQCHGISEERVDSRTFPPDAFYARGHRYRPGDDLAATRTLVHLGEPGARETMLAATGDPDFWDGSFWTDGMVRVSGRENNGLMDSPCARSDRFSCLSCHRMHPRPDDPRPLAQWADDQLAPDMDGDRACLQCHAAYEARERRIAHTHHAPDSAGSRCMNCHMPYTTYGLLKAIRSHQISSPTASESVQTGRPNACNQCHLDRTLGWAAERLLAWYGTARPALPAEHEAVAASVLWLLKGDAGQRALMAWSYGWDDAHAASGSDWLAPYLAELLVDPYDAVRYIANRSLRRLPGFADLAHDFMAAPDARVRAKDGALALWRRTGATGQRHRNAVLVNADGSLARDAVARLLGQRDDRPVRLQE